MTSPPYRNQMLELKWDSLQVTDYRPYKYVDRKSIIFMIATLKPKTERGNKNTNIYTNNI